MGSFSRRAFLKLGAVVGAVAAVGSSTATSFAAVVKKNPKGSGKTTYWNHFTGPDERAGFAKIVEAFKKASPAIDLEVQTITNDVWMTRYIAAKIADSGPDSIMLAPERFADMRQIGGLREITKYYKNWDGAADVASSVGAYNVGNKNYGIPFFNYVDWMYYRKDLLDAAGIKKPPATLEEFRQTAIALTDPSKNQYGFAMRGGSGGGGYIPAVIHAYNGPFIDKFFKRTASFEAVRDAVTFWVNLHIKDKAVVPTVATDGRAQMLANFASGKAAMFLHASGSFNEVSKYFKPGTQLETALVPKGPKDYIGFSTPYANGLFKSAKNPDAGFEFISFIGSAAAQIPFLKATGYFPTSAIASKDEYLTATPQYEAALTGVKTLGLNYSFPGYDAWVGLTCLPELQKALIGAQSAEVSARNIFDELGRVANAAAKANRARYRK